MDELADDARVIAGATAGPWYRWETEDGNNQWITTVESEGPDDFPDGSPHSQSGETICSVGISGELEDEDRANAAFIARARTRYPELVAEVRELRAEIAMLRRHLEREGWKPLKEGDWQTLTKTTRGVRPHQEAP